MQNSTDINPYKVGDKVVLSRMDNLRAKSVHKKFGVKDYYTVTSINNEYVRIEGQLSGYYYDCYKPYKAKVQLPENLFEI